MTTLQEEKMAKCIDSLDPNFKQRVERWIYDVKALGITPYIYCGYRSEEEQNDLYAIGRTKNGTIVTNAKGGQSFHNYHLAFDWVRDLNGELMWDDDDSYAKGAEIGKKYNFRAISWEQGHLEDGTYSSWRDLYSKWHGEENKPSVSKETPEKIDSSVKFNLFDRFYRNRN